MKKILFSLFPFMGILLFGSIGYMNLGAKSFLDGLYMTVITITTVGYGEVIPLSAAGRIFTIALILIGMGYVLFLVGRITEAVVEGVVKKAFRRINMENKIAKISNHYIICGFGRIGKVICSIMADTKKKFVIIEKNPEEIEKINELGFLSIQGDSTDDKTLLEAGIERAKGLVAVVSSDADNVYIVLSARGLNPDLYILTRSSDERNAERKLLRAGANKVVSPYFIGATRMAHVLFKPTVIDFIDLTVHAGELGLRLEEMRVTEGGDYCNSTLQESGIRRDYDLIVVAIKREHGEMLFNPSPQTVIMMGDTLIVLGDLSKIKELEKKL